MNSLFTVMYILGLMLFTIGIFVSFIVAYNVLIGLFGYGKAKKDYEMIEDKTRFLILVAAHNEEAVIASTIENLKTIKYNKELYDIYVVNDNSTDRTEEECIKVGAKYINTAEKLFPREGVGKPGGLQYALRYLGFNELKDKYDMVMILDADNHVDENILSELNSQWIAKNKPEAIQTYLDSKNYNKMLSLGYTVSYIMTNRFFQLAKYRLGLPNALGGTGFVVKTEYLINSGGFNYSSLTEDLEMEIRIVEDNGRILWNHFTRIYDEKPDDIKISIKQRTRWMQGHWYVAINNFIPLIVKFLKTLKWKYIDQLIYLYAGGKAIQLVILLLSLILSGVVLLLKRDISMLPNNLVSLYSSMFNLSFFALGMFLYSIVVQGQYALRVDKKMNISFKSILSILYYAYTFLYCNVKGLLKWRQQGVWVKTTHKIVSKE